MSTWWHTALGDADEAKASRGTKMAGPVSTQTGLCRYDSSLLKTAMQKTIRKGLTGDAVAIAQAMLQQGAAGTIKRRLPVILAEDVGWRTMWMAPLCQADGDDGGGATDLLRFVHIAAQTKPKDKSCEPLMGRARVANRVGKPDVNALGKALRENDLSYAARVIVDQLDPIEKGTGALPIWEDLIVVAKEREAARPGLVDVVNAVRRRLGQGLYTNDRSLATITAAQAVCGRTYNDAPEEGWAGIEGWQKVTPSPSSRQSLVDLWWVFDPHSFLGKIVGGILNKRMGIDPEWLSWGWFCAESGLVSYPRDTEYLKDWDVQVREKFDGETLAQMQQKWTELRPEAEGCMGWLLKQRHLD